MTWNRRNRFTTVLFALVSLLFMQLAMAGYSCSDSTAKRVEAVEAAEVAAIAHSGMPCGESMTLLTMDDEQPSLCHAHCKDDPQSADKYQVPGLPALADLATDFPLLRSTLFISAPSGASLQAPLLRRSTAASLAVRHCCFRI